MLTTVILVIHLLIAIALVGVILLQKSEGGALGMGGSGGGMGGFMAAAQHGQSVDPNDGDFGGRLHGRRLFWRSSPSIRPNAARSWKSRQFPPRPPSRPCRSPNKRFVVFMFRRQGSGPWISPKNPSGRF